MQMIRPQCFLIAFVFFATLGLTGCSEARFSGISPSGRTFNEADAGRKDYYVGLDANFALGRAGEPQGAARSAAAATNVSSTQPIGIRASTRPTQAAP
jgi:hypothetical protein